MSEECLEEMSEECLEEMSEECLEEMSEECLEEMIVFIRAYQSYSNSDIRQNEVLILHQIGPN